MATFDEDNLPIPENAEKYAFASELLPPLAESIRLAAWRMQRSQHQDGGWGTLVERSDFWQTAYAVLFLSAVRFVHDYSPLPDIEGMLRRGVNYLEQHPDRWASDTLSTVDSMNVYDIALMIRCFYRVGRLFMRREYALRLYRSIDRLYHSQNEDGGWDASVWGYEVTTPIHLWSEVGATAIVMQALAETCNERFQVSVEKGIKWLSNTQNQEGSWNDGSCDPACPPYAVSGSASVSKSCDAVQGILSATLLNIPLDSSRATIDRGAAWLRCQEKPLLDRQHYMGSLGWGYTANDYEQTCLTLETLQRVPSEPMEQLVPIVMWLLNGQRRQAGDAEEGDWPLGHTARIALALADFYKRLKDEVNPQSMPWIP